MSAKVEIRLTAPQRHLLALEVARLVAEQTDRMLNEDELVCRLRCTPEALKIKAKRGLPLRKKKGIVGYYAFESELNNYFKNI